jgi:hypothetical protein
MTAPPRPVDLRTEDVRNLTRAELETLADGISGYPPGRAGAAKDEMSRRDREYAERQERVRQGWTPLLTPDRITAAFTVVLALATLALVITAYFQHIDGVEAIQATQRLAAATENAAKDRRQTASAELILKIDAMLQEHRYDRITDDIQSHDSNYHLPKYKNRADADVEEYIGIFEDMGYFIKDSLITEKMAYDHFSYDIEKAWCNTTIQETLRKERANDKSKTAQSAPIYGNFERLAKQYLGSEGQELSPNLGDGLRDQAAAVWDCEDAGLAATSIPSVNLTP